MRRVTLGAVAGLAASILVILFQGPNGPEAPKTFSEAKRIALKIYAAEPVTFYCGCRYSGHQIDLQSCGYQVRHQQARAGRLEWEHIVPAWVFGHQRTCWKQGGRKNCSANDPVFEAIEADLHNLVPSIGEVNGDRSNYALGMLPGRPNVYGACPMQVDGAAGIAMPPERARGAAARVYLYMADRYGLGLPARDRQTYETWNRQYPVSDWERWRNQQVSCVMGHNNPYVGDYNALSCPGHQGSSPSSRIMELLRRFF